MAVFGPVSSIFDFLTFWILLALLHAGHSEFRTGWFVESIATQTLVVYVIRTRRVPFLRSKPSRPMLAGADRGRRGRGRSSPYTGLARLLGFTPLPGAFFLLLAGMVVVYLVLVEVAKALFYRRAPASVRRPVTTHGQRLERRIRRRADALHPAPGGLRRRGLLTPSPAACFYCLGRKVPWTEDLRPLGRAGPAAR